jgi:hypothetical protein
MPMRILRIKAKIQEWSSEVSMEFEDVRIENKIEMMESRVRRGLGRRDWQEIIFASLEGQERRTQPRST